MNGLGPWIWEANERKWTRGPHSFTSGSSLLTSGMAYFAYMGFTSSDITIDYVRFLVRTAGAGAQTAEVGVYTSPNSPQGAAQTLTKIAATGTLDSLTSTGVKGNSSALGAAVSGGSHVWAGIRTAMATTQPRVLPYVWDGGLAACLEESGASALTATSSNSPSVVASTDLNTHPVIQVELQ